MPEKVWLRLRREVLWFLFAWILLIPKTLALRRQPREWNILRLVLGMIGMALVAGALEFGARGSSIMFLVGLVLILFALIGLPERPRLSVDARSKELGALVVVKGGDFHAAGAWAETLLFVGPQRLSLLEAASLRPLLEMALAQVTLLRAEPVNNGWKLHIVCANSAADLLYGGPFAEHFARVAESTVRSQLPNALPILQR